jgi:hypothetical protein
MKMDESKALKKNTRVYWQGDGADSGVVTETSWDAVTIAWNNGQVARVHRGDMREIHRMPTKLYAVAVPNQSPSPLARQQPQHGPRLVAQPGHNPPPSPSKLVT